MEKVSVDNKPYVRWIFIISLLIPLVVAFLILLPSKTIDSGNWVRYLPGFHALINSLTIITLLMGLWFVKRGQISSHKACMSLSFILGCLFLLSYIIYHIQVESVKFGDINHDGVLSSVEQQGVGSTRTVYLILLTSHILLSIGVVPFVLMSFYYALIKQIVKHRKIVRYTLPIWLYVSVTGVIVYLMIEPYY